jgi:predicted outer membrane protein
VRLSRNATGTLFVGGALSLTLVALAYPTMLGLTKASTAEDRVIANTQWGPLTEQDRDFVVKVRAAGLWEYPLGKVALEKGTTEEVKEAGRHLIDGHAALDEACRKIAPMLNITLPNNASPQQIGFVNQIQNSSGEEFNKNFANILRTTHGSIFNTIAKIRSTTKNSLVRSLADMANDTVLDHITVMEKTGYVDFDQALFQQTTPPKLPDSDLTPPPPQPGEVQVVLTPPPNATSTPLEIPNGSVPPRGNGNGNGGNGNGNAGNAGGGDAGQNPAG